MIDWEILSVIESQLNTWDFSKTRWYPLKQYSQLVNKLKEDLSSLMMQKEVKLK